MAMLIILQLQLLVVYKLVKCMELAIKDAGIDPKEINYINAHGTSTGLNDKNETLAIKELFGDHAKDIAVNSTNL